MTPENRRQLVVELTRDEGLMLSAYRDTAGLWTIGVGHLLGETARMTLITTAEAMALLDADIDVALGVVRRVLPEANLDGNFPRVSGSRLRALVNMAFNRGEGNMRSSTTITPAIRAALDATEDLDIAWAKVGEAIMASPWAKQVGKRAERLAYMLVNGKDPA